MPPMKKKPTPAKVGTGRAKKPYKALTVQNKARAQAMKNMTPAQRKKNDQLAKFGKDVLLPASLAVLPIGRAGTAVKAGRAVSRVAKAKTARKILDMPIKEATKITNRAANSVKHPSGRMIDRRTGAVYDAGMKTVKRATPANAARYRAGKIANSPAARDLAKVKRVIKKSAGPGAGLGATYKVLDKLDKDQKKFQDSKKKKGK